MLSRLSLVFVFFVLFDSGLLAQYAALERDNSLLGINNSPSRIICQDINNDGAEEIVTSGKISSDSRLLIYSYAEGRYYVSWASKVYEKKDISVIKLADPDNDKIYDIYVFFSDGLVDCYDGASKKIKSSFVSGMLAINQVRIEDIDGDGTTEILTVNNTTFTVYDSAFAEKFSSNDFGGSEAAIGDIDGDNVNEIVIASGAVLSGKTFEQKWKYSNGFGLKIEIADINQDSVKDIVFINPYSINAVDGRKKKLFWQVNTSNSNINSLRKIYIEDVDKDNTWEIIVTALDYNRAACYKPGAQLLCGLFPSTIIV